MGKTITNENKLKEMLRKQRRKELVEIWKLRRLKIDWGKKDKAFRRRLKNLKKRYGYAFLFEQEIWPLIERRGRPRGRKISVAPEQTAPLRKKRGHREIECLIVSMLAGHPDGFEQPSIKEILKKHYGVRDERWIRRKLKVLESKGIAEKKVSKDKRAIWKLNMSLDAFPRIWKLFKRRDDLLYLVLSYYPYEMEEKHGEVFRWIFQRHLERSRKWVSPKELLDAQPIPYLFEDF